MTPGGDRRRVLVLIKTVGPGGAERLLATSARHLDHSRFAYRVGYVAPEPVAILDDLDAAGVRADCLAHPSQIVWLARLHALLRDWRPALVHVHSPYVAVGARLVAGAQPVVYTEHSLWPSHRRLTRWGNRATFSRNAHSFAVSDVVRASMPAAADVEVLHHGVDFDDVARWRREPVDLRAQFGVPPGAPLIVTVANLRPQKDHATLVDAAALVRRSVPEARFLLVGSGPLEAELRQRVRDRGLEHTVLFGGHRPDAGRFAAAADLFVLPSVHDGLSIALIEALALARPVVVTAAGGNVEAVRDGREGLVVPPGDPAALADAVTRLLADPPLRSQLGAAAGRRALAFDIRAAVRRQEEVYGELLETGRTR